MTTAFKYFEDHPSERDGVMKAYYAYHAPHFRLEPKGHNFGSALRESQCHWCGRSRETVRWDDLPAECCARPSLPDIEETIFSEEEKAFVLLERAVYDVPRLVSKLGMSGDTLAILHHTHGFDAETVSCIVDVSPQMLSDYHVAMELERERSRGAQVKDVISAAA